MNQVFTIKGTNSKEIIAHLAEQFDTDFEDNNQDFCFDVPSSYGKGHFRTVQFSHGVQVMEIELRLKKNISLEYEKQSVNLLRFFYNSISKVEHSTNVERERDKIGKLQCAIFSNGIDVAHQFHFDKDDVFSIYMIEINRKLFEEKIEAISDRMPDDLEPFFKDVNGVNDIYHKAIFSLEISTLIEEFRHADMEDMIHEVFLEAKTNEILTFQLESYHQSKNGKKKQAYLRQSTIEKIERAVEIIKGEMEVGINVHTLAKRVGLNQNTLQSGFQNLFQSSVNSYVQKYRLDMAKKLIEETDLNITEITYRIGINSRSYFSKLFKDQFGVSPSAYLNQFRKKQDKSA